MPLKDVVAGSTVRDVVHLSLGGAAVRITLTNEFGTTPLRIDEVHLALSAKDGKVKKETDRRITFGHQAAVWIPAGSYVLSDPIAMPIAAFSDFAISLYLPQQPIAAPTCHQWALSTNYFAMGNVTAESELHNARPLTSWCFVQGVDVWSGAPDAGSVVAFGDSITDGARSTVDANRRYPDVLAARLQANQKTAHLAVVNEGIAGGRVLFEGHGPSALARFDRDVLAQPGIRYVIYLEGINDIGQILKSDSPEKALEASDLAFAASQLVARAHQHGVKVFGATLLPYGPGDVPPKPGLEKIRQLIDRYNNWVRTGGVFDGVVDFNKATADPHAPQTMLPLYNSGDNGHPNDAGYKAMADAIDLALFDK
jgi:lysophospholipase L1-like esterase